MYVTRFNSISNFSSLRVHTYFPFLLQQHTKNLMLFVEVFVLRIHLKNDLIDARAVRKQWVTANLIVNFIAAPIKFNRKHIGLSISSCGELYRKKFDSINFIDFYLNALQRDFNAFPRSKLSYFHLYSYTQYTHRHTVNRVNYQVFCLFSSFVI